MHPREEDLYRYWERSAHTGRTCRCVGGQRVIVLSAGERNRQAGPDFRDAVLLIDGVLAVGAVEMHIHERDWFAHGHQNDPAYTRVILHLLAVRPDVLKLSLPTIIADLNETPGVPDDPWLAYPDCVRLSPEILAECAWNRLIRRATEVIRAEPMMEPHGRLRREFVRRLFDCLGYHNNRDTMVRLAESLIAGEEAMTGGTFERIAGRVFRASGLDREEWMASGRSFMPEERLRALTAGEGTGGTTAWRRNTQPANMPARRLWGGSRLLYDIYSAGLIAALDGSVRATGSLEYATGRLCVRIGSEQFIGRGRAAEIAVNALLPVSLAGSALRADAAGIVSVCRAYREAPSLGTNGSIRSMERWYHTGRMSGAFWQQGAIEFRQRYRSADRSGLSFVAETEHSQQSSVTFDNHVHRII